MAKLNDMNEKEYKITVFTERIFLFDAKYYNSYHYHYYSAIKNTLCFFCWKLQKLVFLPMIKIDFDITSEKTRHLTDSDFFYL